MNKPRLPFIAIILAVVLISGGVLFVSKHLKKDSLASKTREISTEYLRDSDNDGLKDWEEELFKTDPNNPDTDSDGYLDGEEINSGHNPLVKAPGDKLGFYPLPLGDQYNITKKVLNDEVVSSILTSYLAQKGEYINDHPETDSQEAFLTTINQSTLQEMSQRALANSSIIFEKAQETISQIPEIFDINITDENIKISDDNSKEAIETYLSQAASIINADSFFLKEQSIQALSSAYEKGDFSQLDNLIKINDEKIENAKEIIIPSSWKEIHKEGLKLTLVIRNVYVSFRDVNNDPLKAYVAIKEFENFPNTWNDLIKNAINLAKEQNVNLPL